MNVPVPRPILVIEPDPSVRFLIVTLLQRQGYIAEATGHSDEALRLHRAAPHAAIVLDPRTLGGDSLLRALQTGADGGMPSRNLIVVTTPHHSHRSWADHPGVHAMLLKPFRLDDLASAVAACCRF